MKILSVGRSRLSGSVNLSGAKNSALRLLAASLLTKGELVLENYPDSLLDAQVHVEMLHLLGKTCTPTKGRIVISEAVSDTGSVVTKLIYDKRSIRNTLLILGALTARHGSGAVPLPGGCQLGDRKFDLHVLVLEALGAKVFELDGYLCAEAPNGLLGAEIDLPLRSTGATENAVLCASLAKGVTRIWNPHIRPEILDLIEMLRSMGAEIEVRGQESIIVTGKQLLHGATHRVVADNMEALTWLIGAAVTGGDVEIHDFPYDHLEVPLIHLRESGVKLFRSEKSLIVRSGACYPVEISTGPYPGINSDMQPLFAVFGAVALGETRIIDLRFPGRYAYAEEFKRMGVDYLIDGNMLKIRGGAQLTGAEVTAADLRAGAALLLMGMVATGRTNIHDAWQIERGYDHFSEKLKALGADVSWI